MSPTVIDSYVTNIYAISHITTVAYVVYLVRIVYLPYPVDHSELLRLFTHTHIHPYSSTSRTVCVRSN